MIIKFKIFENFDEIEKKSNKYDIKQIENELRKKFDSEEQFETYCMLVDNRKDFNDVDLGNVAAYDIPNLLKLPTYDDELTSIIIDILTETNFDDYFEPRDGNFEEWRAKKVAKNYNL